MDTNIYSSSKYKQEISSKIIEEILILKPRAYSFKGALDKEKETMWKNRVNKMITLTI